MKGYIMSVSRIPVHFPDDINGTGVIDHPAPYAHLVQGPTREPPGLPQGRTAAAERAARYGRRMFWHDYKGGEFNL